MNVCWEINMQEPVRELTREPSRELVLLQMVMHVRVVEYLAQFHGTNGALMGLFKADRMRLLEMYPLICADYPIGVVREVEQYLATFSDVLSLGHVAKLCGVSVELTDIIMGYLDRLNVSLVRSNFDNLDVWQLEDRRERLMRAVKMIDDRLEEMEAEVEDI